MRILLINSNQDGGAGIACKRLAQGLEKHTDINADILFKKSSNGKNDGIDYEPYSLRNLLKVKLLKRHLAFRKLYLDKKSLAPTYEAFNFPVHGDNILNHPLYQKADIIHLHWVSNMLDYKSFFAKNKKPVVWTLHDMEPFSGGYHYEIDILPEYQELITSNSKIKQEACNKAELNIVSPSIWLKKLAQNSGIFNNSKFHHIPNGVDPEHFHLLKEGENKRENGAKNILFIAQNITNKRKGFEFIKELISNTNYNWTAIGESNKTASDKVNFLGKISEIKSLRQHYNQADLFVIPSIEDNFPNTILEALFCGTPVVGFDVGGISEMITNGKNGFLSKEKTISSLEDSIARALNHKFDRTKIAEEARKKWNLKKHVNSYVEIYKAIHN